MAWTVLCLAGILFLAPFPRAESNPLAARAQAEYEAAREKFQKSPHDPEAAWKFARASFDWAEWAANHSEREKVAEEGMEAARRAIDLAPGWAAGHYYLALNTGQLARTKTIGALRLVRDMEQEWSKAAELDPHFDYAGPDRALGILYFEAPGWPVSVGNRKKARLHLERAAALHPEHPENHIALIEAYLKWGDRKSAQRQFQRLQQIWPEAKKRFTGDQWAADWADWTRRRDALGKEFER